MDINNIKGTEGSILLVGNTQKLFKYEDEVSTESLVENINNITSEKYVATYLNNLPGTSSDDAATLAENVLGDDDFLSAEALAKLQEQSKSQTTTVDSSNTTQTSTISTNKNSASVKAIQANLNAAMTKAAKYQKLVNSGPKFLKKLFQKKLNAQNALIENYRKQLSEATKDSSDTASTTVTSNKTTTTTTTTSKSTISISATEANLQAAMKKAAQYQKLVKSGPTFLRKKFQSKLNEQNALISKYRNQLASVEKDKTGTALASAESAALKTIASLTKK